MDIVACLQFIRHSPIGCLFISLRLLVSFSSAIFRGHSCGSMQDTSNTSMDMHSNPIYGDLLRQQSTTIRDTREHIERMLGELEVCNRLPTVTVFLSFCPFLTLCNHRLQWRYDTLLISWQEKKELCTAKRITLNTFKKDITESFTDCRSHVKKSVTSMINYLKQQQVCETQFSFQ